MTSSSGKQHPDACSGDSAGQRIPAAAAAPPGTKPSTGRLAHGAAKSAAVVVPSYGGDTPDADPETGGSGSSGSSAVVTSPFAAADAQEAWHARQASLVRETPLALISGAAAPAHALSAAPPPPTPQHSAAPLPPLGPPRASSDAAAGELPPQPLHARHGIPALWASGSGDDLEGPLGAVGSPSLRRASGGSGGSGGGNDSPSTKLHHFASESAPPPQNGHNNPGRDPPYIHQPAHRAGGLGAARRSILRVPASAPHSPRQRHSADVRDGRAAAAHGLPPRRRQLSWDAGSSPLGDSPLRSLAVDRQGYRHTDFGAAAAAAEQEPKFFDPNAHAARLRQEREAPAAAEWRGEVPAWSWAPQRAVIEAAGGLTSCQRSAV